jgi:hypothetical protein
MLTMMHGSDEIAESTSVLDQAASSGLSGVVSFFGFSDLRAISVVSPNLGSILIERARVREGGIGT